jgi:hypothetical protein
VRVPAKSASHAVLRRHGLVKPPGRPHQRAKGTALSAGLEPNALWRADFKGEFKLGDGRYCYPLTFATVAMANKTARIAWAGWPAARSIERQPRPA